MSKAINNPNFIATNDSPEGSAPITGQILDGFDFPHTGLIKVFNLACAGSYAIRGFNGTNINATQATFAGGAVFLKGTLTPISGPTTVTISGNSPKTHHLLVARAGAIVLIQGTVDNEVPPFVDGDVIIALLKYTGSDPMQIQYLTFNQTYKSLSIGRLDTNTNQYLEGLSIKSTPSGNSIGDIIIESFEQDKDIVFKVNDGGSPSQEILRIDASDKEVYLDKGYLHLKSDDAGEAPKLTLENRNNGVDAGAIHFLKDGSSPANNDKIGTIIFESESALSADHTYADIMVYSKDTTNSAEHGRMNFRISKAGSLVSALDINDDEIVVNETSKDINFRVESDTNQNMFVVDASTDRIGIGTATPVAPLHVMTSNTDETLRLQSDDATATTAPDLIFHRNSASPAASDGIGHIKFLGRNAANNADIMYAAMYASIRDTTANNEDGSLIFTTETAGNDKNRMAIMPTEVNINDNGEALNFRVESDSNVNMLFVDGTNNKVGIGTNTPSATLEVATGGTFRSPRLPMVSVSASTTLTEATHAGAYLKCAGNVTLPATSSDGEHYTILNTTNGNITVGRNGNNINGAGSDATVSTFNAVTCIAIGSNDWIVLGV
jgi:hypothetical protein